MFLKGCALTLNEMPGGLAAWRMTVLEGAARLEWGLLLSMIPAQDVTVALFEHPDCDDSLRRALLPNRRRAELIGVVERIARDDPDSGRPKALFLAESSDFSRDVSNTGITPPCWRTSSAGWLASRLTWRCARASGTGFSSRRQTSDETIA